MSPIDAALAGWTAGLMTGLLIGSWVEWKLQMKRREAPPSDSGARGARTGSDWQMNLDAIRAENKRLRVALAALEDR